MGVIRNINFKITGQVQDEWHDNDYEIVKKEIELICAKYNLDFEEN